MEILINGEPADIIIESEKIIGDVLASLEKWLEGTGKRLSGLNIDGTETGAESLQQAIGLDLESIKTLDIQISSWDSLAMEALNALRDFCAKFTGSAFNERGDIFNEWEKSAVKSFLSTDINDMHDMACLSFSGEGVTPAELGVLTEERLMEFSDPRTEIGKMEKPIHDIYDRLKELPLDMQTGKDGRAAETIRLFTQTGEKLFRLVWINNFQHRADFYEIKGQPLKTFIHDFTNIVVELTEAYKNKDTVLIGDLAEYELAPRLIDLDLMIKMFRIKEE